MIISPFTPLFFDEPKGDRLPSAYVQTFAHSDPIFVQCFCDNSESPSFAIDDGIKRRAMGFQQMRINDDVVLWYAVIRGLEDGVFRLVETSEGHESEPFMVTSDPRLLANTVLVHYAMSDNLKRTDGIFMLNATRQFFAFRVPGGFKNADWTFNVDNEQFSTPDGDLVTLYSTETVQKKFTMGCADGVPVWFAELLNRALSCSYVYFDGVRYSRVGTSVPEATEISDAIDSFVFKVNVQKVVHLDPMVELQNMISIRKYNATGYRTVSVSGNNYNLLTE